MRYAVAENGCWNWLGSISNTGYGQATLWGKPGPAHRAAYELLVGRIPRGWEVHHSCHNRHCINPEHLNVLHPNTHAELHENYAHLTMCKYGHLLDEANTYVRKDGGGRQCRICKARRERERNQQKRIAAGKISRYPAIRALDEEFIAKARQP
jgi:hypothetical protein